MDIINWNLNSTFQWIVFFYNIYNKWIKYNKKKNISGLVLIVIFLGYGLVAVPKYFYRQNDFMIKLKREYSDYYKNTYNISDSEFELEDYIQVINIYINK